MLRIKNFMILCFVFMFAVGFTIFVVYDLVGIENILDGKHIQKNYTTKDCMQINCSEKYSVNKTDELYKKMLNERGYCGDNVCNPKNNESKSTCCIDCGCEENMVCLGGVCILQSLKQNKTVSKMPKTLFSHPVEYPYQLEELNLIESAKKDERVQEIINGKDYFVVGRPIIGSGFAMVDGKTTTRKDVGESGSVLFEVDNKTYNVKIENLQIVSINETNETRYNIIPECNIGLPSGYKPSQQEMEEVEKRKKECDLCDSLYGLAFNDEKTKNTLEGKDFLLLRGKWNPETLTLQAKIAVGKRGFPGTFNKGYEIVIDGNSKSVGVQEIANKTELRNMLRNYMFGGDLLYIYGEIKNQTNGMEKIFISLDDVA